MIIDEDKFNFVWVEGLAPDFDRVFEEICKEYEIGVEYLNWLGTGMWECPLDAVIKYADRLKYRKVYMSEEDFKNGKWVHAETLARRARPDLYPAQSRGRGRH